MMKLTEFPQPSKSRRSLRRLLRSGHVQSHSLDQHPEHGGYVYFTSARPRHYRNYSAPNMAMWCCVGTGMENHGKYGQLCDSFKGAKSSDDALYLNLFVASQLNWRDKGMVLRQKRHSLCRIIAISVVKGKGDFTLKIRKPHGATTSRLKAWDSTPTNMKKTDLCASSANGRRRPT
ncbi:beta-L-arabinofuranosidase domain-containing protein [Muribaculum gordoncarteri]|uniref:beta-L-arabinofuranosidase domain-containing protein n=1 Tax=Muribaculum gordoncarteri TaxID=2530390 RepID=UPI003F67723A